MKKTSILAITLLPSLLLLSFVMIENNLTGMAVSNLEIPEGGIPSYGLSMEDRGMHDGLRFCRMHSWRYGLHDSKSKMNA